MNTSFRERCAPSRARRKGKRLLAQAAPRQMTGVPYAASPGSWQQTTVCERRILNVFIAVLKSLYPWLLYPSWIMQIDPESV